MRLIYVVLAAALHYTEGFQLLSPSRRTFVVPELRSIPPEAFDVVADAEANSPAGKSRTLRVAGYGTAAAVSSCIGLVQAAGVGGAEVPDWVDYLPASGYLGCFFDTIATAFFATFITLEFQTRDKNREDIYEELMRRKGGGSVGSGGGSEGGLNTKKKKKKKKNKKQRGLDEIASLEAEKVKEEKVEEKVEARLEEKITTAEEPSSKKSILDKAKDFYKEADSMAYQNALLLNKKLEDEGVLEKITDETGLKVMKKKNAGVDGDDDDNDV